MDADHAKGNERDLKHLAGGENCIAVRVLAEHSAEHSTRDREVGRAKIDPRDANRGISGDAGENARAQIICPRFVFEEDRQTRSITK